MKLHNMFRKAEEDESLRQMYLDEICKLCPPHVKKIVYDPSSIIMFADAEELYTDGIITDEKLQGIKSSHDEDLGMFGYQFGVLMPHPLIGRGGKQKIYTMEQVFEGVFEGGVEKHDEVLSAVLDHELIHINQIRKGIKLPNCPVINYTNIGHLSDELINFAAEVPAYINQLTNIKNRNLRETFVKANCIAALENFHTWLEEITPENSLEEQTYNSLTDICKQYKPNPRRIIHYIN